MSEPQQISGYEIRANMLHLAKDILENRMHAAISIMSQRQSQNSDIINRVEVSDVLFNHLDVINVATDLYRFVQTK
jgi:hypothetical protein